MKVGKPFLREQWVQLLLFLVITSTAEGAHEEVKFLSGAAMHTISAETPRSTENVSVIRSTSDSAEALVILPPYSTPSPSPEAGSHGGKTPPSHLHGRTLWSSLLQVSPQPTSL